jgi:hypothetical protein
MEPALVIVQIGLGIAIALCMWAQVFPRSNWRVFWGWQYRFSHVPQREQVRYVRRLTVVPLVLSVLMTVVIQVWR